MRQLKLVRILSLAIILVQTFHNTRIGLQLLQIFESFLLTLGDTTGIVPE